MRAIRENCSPAERNIAVLTVLLNAYFALLALALLSLAAGTWDGAVKYLLFFGPGWLAFWAVVQKARKRRTWLGPYGAWIAFAFVNGAWLCWTFAYEGSLGIPSTGHDQVVLGLISASIGLSVLGFMATRRARRLARR